MLTHIANSGDRGRKRPTTRHRPHIVIALQMGSLNPCEVSEKNNSFAFLD
jgi:hypothetical protein